MQSEKAVSAYFTSKQILPFGFVKQRGVHVQLCSCCSWPVFNTSHDDKEQLLVDWPRIGSVPTIRAYFD